MKEEHCAPPGGGGGTQIWFRRGCAAEAAKPVPIFKGHFGGKGYPLLGVFIQENEVFVYFSDEMGENIVGSHPNRRIRNFRVRIIFRDNRV